MGQAAKQSLVEVIYLKDRLGRQGRWDRRRGMTETIPRHLANTLVKEGTVRIIAETKVIEPAEMKAPVLSSVSPPVGPEARRLSRREKKKQAKENGKA